MKKPLLVALFIASFCVRSFAQIPGGQTSIFVASAESWNGQTFPAILKLPAEYSSTTKKYPLMVFLHGTGESGNINGTQLANIYNSSTAGGPAYFIAHNSFPDSFANPLTGQYSKFIILSPQAPGWSSSGNQLMFIINDMVARYRIDTNRIYITGLSAGGQGVIDYAAHIGTTPVFKAAAMVPLSIAESASQASANIIVADSVRAWGLGSTSESHGVATRDEMNFMNNTLPGVARFTDYPGGHCCWNTYYNPNYKEVINGRSMNMYEWMLMWTRSTTPAGLTVNAGPDQAVLPPTATLNGTANDPSGTITSYTWTKVNGTAANIVNPTSPATAVTGLASGTYTFQLTVTDNIGAVVSSSVNVAIMNQSPTANAGANQTITLPGSSATLSGSGTDPDGTIAGYAWSLVSGPNTPGYSAQNAATTNVTGLIQGVYVFKLTVTDNSGATGSATVNVTVNAAANQPPVANAGSIQVITLPVSLAILTGSGTDPDGIITGYAWSLVSGPNTPGYTAQNSAIATVLGLIAGTYTFKLTVTDNQGATASANTVVTVNAAGAPVTTGKYFRAITVDHTKVINSNQLSFPVLVSGNFPFLKTTANGGKVTNANGYDITFTSDSTGNNKLNWEIEKYNPATGDLTAWVNTDLSPATDKIFYIQYGDNTISAFQGNIAGTWNNGYAAVYHLKDGAILNAGDATVNNVSGTINGATATTGQIGGGANLNGSSQYIDLGNHLGITGDITISAWVKPNNFNNENGILAKTAWNQPKPYDFKLWNGSGVPTFFRGDGTGANDHKDANTAPSLNVWSYVVVTTNGSLVSHYLNGNTNGSGSLGLSGVAGNGTNNAYIGTREDRSLMFAGGLDEIRVSTIARSADWVKTEYNNQSSPSSFFSVGIESGSGNNQSPVANAGSNQTITSPATSTTLSGSGTDPDGTIAGYAWSLVSGPSTPGYSAQNAATTNITGLIVGTYVFKLTVTDNLGATGTANVSVTVNAASSGSGKYFRPVIVNHIKVINTNQLSFPVLVCGNFPFLKTIANGGKVNNANGYDIMFTSDSNATAKLNWEIEKYNPATGDLTAWVNTDISPVTDKIFYIQYGDNTIATFQGNVNGTWNNGYAAVYHLKDGTILNAGDATSNAVNGTITGATATTGQMGGGANLSGSSQYIDLGNHLGITGDITISAWVKPSNFNSENGILAKTAWNQPKPYDFKLWNGSGVPTFFRGDGTGANDHKDATTAPALNVWSYIVVTTNSSLVSHYLNGNTNGSGNLNGSGAAANGTNEAFIGTREDKGPMFAGGMDEIRVSTIARSADWVKTEYNNQSSPSTFFTIGVESSPGYAGSSAARGVSVDAAVKDENAATDLPGSSLKIFPNPFNNEFTVQMNNELAGTMIAELFNMNGALLKTIQFTKISGPSQLFISAPGLPAGVYLLRLRIGKWSVTQKLQKL